MIDEGLQAGTSRTASDARNASAEMIFDPNAAMDRLDGDAELFRMLAALYQTDSIQLFHQLRDAASRGDIREVQRTSHSLKGLAANFDGRFASQAAAKIEGCAKAGDLEGAKEFIADLELQLEKLRQALTSFHP